MVLVYQQMIGDNQGDDGGKDPDIQVYGKWKAGLYDDSGKGYDRGNRAVCEKGLSGRYRIIWRGDGRKEDVKLYDRIIAYLDEHYKRILTMKRRREIGISYSYMRRVVKEGGDINMNCEPPSYP